MQQDNLTIHTLWEDLLAVLRRRRAVVAVATLSTMVTVYVCLLFVTDKYEAHASLLVMLGHENAEVPVTVERGTISKDGVRKEEVNSYLALLASPSILMAAIDEVGLDRFKVQPDHPTSLFAQAKSMAKRGVRWGKEQLDELLIRVALRPRLGKREQVRLLLERNLAVSNEKESSVIHLSLCLPDAVLARDVLKALIRNYLEQHAKLVRPGNAVVQALEDESRTHSNQLSQLREAASKLKARLGVSSVNEQKLQLFEMLKVAELGKQQSELELAKVEAEQAALLQRRPKLDEQLVTSLVVNPSVAQMKGKELLAELRVKKAQAITKYEANSEPVRRIEEQIVEAESLTKQVAAEESGPRTFTRNPIVAHMEFQQEDDAVKVVALRAAAREADRQIARIKTDLQRMDQAETELQTLQLEINVAETRFLANAAKREQARSQATLDRFRITNVSILSPPGYSEKPTAPKRLLIMLLGLVAGLLGGAALGLCLEWQSDLIWEGRDLEKIAAGTYLGTFAPAQSWTFPRGRAGSKSTGALP